MPPKFLYFDLGNVLLYFDHRRAARQLAALVGHDEQTVYEAVFTTDLNFRCDAGLVDAAEFCRLFREQFSCTADNRAICRAASDIFRVNVPMKAILSQLSVAGHRLGLLSNTCDMHYDFFASGRYEPIPQVFDTVVLSYELKRMKPDPEIYLDAAKRAGVAPEEVFYVDDITANITGAQAAGFDAVPYTTPVAYAAELRRRGIAFNY